MSLAVVLACTALAEQWRVFAPLAAVAEGFLIGSLTDRIPAALSSRENFECLWHLLDALLNTFLFVLLALEVVVLRFSGTALLLGALSVQLLVNAAAATRRVFPVHAPRDDVGWFAWRDQSCVGAESSAGK
ncbi:hypothetical protein DES52_11612 [Deinococcus yavapaiensis KR-236]|uniref:Cation/H+ exchanger domain-containing protein n=1 Tax=Deinococcus yavapaiensis KR-236 TaxID=694435 RepID=A0A318S0U9_9DEIO|nr:hypothetical protein DES52_11612 [Deinococcus yavapaiensis KR-236]